MAETKKRQRNIASNSIPVIIAFITFLHFHVFNFIFLKIKKETHFDTLHSRFSSVVTARSWESNPVKGFLRTPTNFQVATTGPTLRVKINYLWDFSRNINLSQIYISNKDSLPHRLPLGLEHMKLTSCLRLSNEPNYSNSSSHSFAKSLFKIDLSKVYLKIIKVSNLARISYS